MLISIIVPCYNEEQSLPYFIEEYNKLKTNKQFYNVDLELVLVNEGTNTKLYKL